MLFQTLLYMQLFSVQLQFTITLYISKKQAVFDISLVQWKGYQRILYKYIYIVCRFTTYQLSADIFHFNEFLEKEYRDLSFMADFKINILLKFYTVNFNNVRIPKV